MFEQRLVIDAPAPVAGEIALDEERIARAVRELLLAIGEDPERAGLHDTPSRVAQAYRTLFSGYAVDPVAVLDPLPGERASGLIMVRQIPLLGLCEHHMLPFVGTAAVAYLPGETGEITGLSKLARLIEVLARRLTVQERLVREAADALEVALRPAGVWVLAEAEHLCMSARGARAAGSVTVTTEVRGVFADDAAARAELLALARASG